MILSTLKEKRSWIIAFGVFVIGLLILELFLRIFVYLKTENQIHSPDFEGQAKAGTVYFQAFEGYGTTHYVATDEIETPYTNGMSVVVFGDSFTEGFQVNDDEKYVSITENLLHERGIEADLHNFGKSSQSLADQIWFYKYIYPQYQPKIAVFQLSLSDFFADNNTYDSRINYFIKQADGSLQIQHQPIAVQSENKIVRFISRNSSLVSYGITRFNQIRTLILDKYFTSKNVKSTSTDTIKLIDEETIFEKMAILKKETAGVKLIIILAPPVPYIENDIIVLDNPQYDKLISSLKKIPDLVVIDPSPTFVDLLKTNHFPSGSINSVPGHGHWNKDGHTIVGQLLADALQKAIQ
jgi:lysophospholipase L1-like esterase